MKSFLFIGERPSHQAVKIGATWQNGKLAAKQLHDALRAVGIDPHTQNYINLYKLPDIGEQDCLDEADAIRQIRQCKGRIVVGMGQIVCRVLERENIPHIPMVHPAARGRIRKKERYVEHVRASLTLSRVCD